MAKLNGEESPADAIARTIAELSKLPGIGGKTAQRLTFHLLQAGPERARALADALAALACDVRLCAVCHNPSSRDPCPICADPARDPAVICVLERPQDLLAVERTHEYRGVYHVLHGVLSPLDGVGPEQLKLRTLMRRLTPPAAGEAGIAVREVILATGASTAGDVTAHFIARMVRDAGFDVAVTRIASGIPIGGDLEYTDQLTLGRALAGRAPMH